MIDKMAGDVIWVADPSSTRHPLHHDAMFRRLTQSGWEPIEAGNLIAHLEGLAPSRRGWTLAEIDHLLFLRTMNETGRLER